MTVNAELKNYFTWNYRTSIPVFTTLIIPLAVETIHFGIELYKDPRSIKERFSILKEKVQRHFIKQENETKASYKKRLIKNIALLAGAILIAGGTSVASFYTLPAGMAIASAIVALLTIGKTYQLIRTLPKKIKNAKNFVIDTFNQRPEESVEAFKKRRLQGGLKIAMYSGLFALAVGGCVLGGFVGKWISQAPCHWFIHEALPFQNKKIVVFLEYATLGVAHAALGVRYLLKKDRVKAGFHFSAAALSIGIPLAYLLPGQELRIHHSFLGLMLMLIPARPIQIFGTCVTLDSMLYFTGYNKSSYEYDYMNAVIDQLPLVINSLSISTAVQKILQKVLKLTATSKKDEKKKTPQEPPIQVVMQS